MRNHLVPTLIAAKIFFALLTFYFFAVMLGWNMFSYPDYYHAYSNCLEVPSANILYPKLFCAASYIADRPMAFDSVFFISAAAFINMFILIGYFIVCEKYLNKYGKYVLIILFVTHPYMNIYFFRLYTDLFASLGIFLMFFYKMKNININIFFVISAVVLINFRVALIPVFVVYGLWEMYSQYIKKNYKALFFSILLIFISLMSYLPVMEISTVFITMNSDINLIEKILTNIVLAFGFRESIGISRDIFIFNEAIDFLSFGTSVIFIIIHSIGLYGIIKLSFKQNISILLVFTYLLAPILALAHMRYLLPLMPILLFGFTYVFFRKKRGG